MARGAGAWQPHSEQYVSGLERGRRRLGQSQVIHTNNVRSLPRSRRRCGAPLRAILSRCRRNRFSTSSRRRDLNRLATNIPSVRRIATIGFHAMILPHDANPGSDAIFGKDRSGAPAMLSKVSTGPPRGIGRELVAAASLHQADVAFLGQVEELQASHGRGSHAKSIL